MEKKETVILPSTQGKLSGSTLNAMLSGCAVCGIPRRRLPSTPKAASKSTLFKIMGLARNPTLPAHGTNRNRRRASRFEIKRICTQQGLKKKDFSRSRGE